MVVEHTAGSEVICCYPHICLPVFFRFTFIYEIYAASWGLALQLS